ncbi:MAG: helix-turn-helix transcriptional regulator [Pseudomonadota bacterium]
MSRGPISVSGFCGDVFETQRRLRSQLLDRPIIRHAAARDLAAHMLLSIDDLTACWSLATSWLRTELQCHRVDAGFGVAHAKDYYPGVAEAKNANYDIPSFGGAAVFNRDPAMQAMWLGSHPVIFADIKQDRRVTTYLRKRMSGARTKSKFGGALRTKTGSYGLICADWTEHLAPNESGLYDCFEQTVEDVLGPIIAVSKEIADQDPAVRNESRQDDDQTYTLYNHSASHSLEGLTSSELDVARLVARGLSYKEIARIRGRSFSTIDHQLRSIRRKTGVSSTSALVSLLAKVETWKH